MIRKDDQQRLRLFIISIVCYAAICTALIVAVGQPFLFIYFVFGLLMFGMAWIMARQSMRKRGNRRGKKIGVWKRN